ncbi:hypothetical protein DRB96_22900 [Streptomyces sp. ICC1]|nr:hypothetical protein DRB89_00645 [Streptomyces sp. ICC4]AWZ14633.1 hypothetical protein DRB96_22900 [Streptomyces sp. ICC1]
MSAREWIDLGRHRLTLSQPLSTDHQLLRIQQGRPIIVGLRSEAVRIAPPSQARPGEAAMTGIVEHVEYQGHEALVHVDTGSSPAVVTELEAPRQPTAPRRGHKQQQSCLRRLRNRAMERLSGPVAVLEDLAEAAPDAEATVGPARRGAVRSDLVVRTGPHVRVRVGARIPLLVDLAQLYVFDHAGRRICPAPDELPSLER